MKTNAFYRIYKIVSMAVLFLFQVIWFEKRHRIWNEKSETDWENLMKRQAVTYKNTAIELEGLLIKLGQFMSARADLLPRPFIDELEGLVDKVPSLPWKEAKETLERSWDCPYRELLSEIGEQPVASASIGEVYKGRLYDGSEVAVKIQRREVAKIMHIDFKAVRIVVWLIKRLTSFGRKMNIDGVFRELVEVTQAELDFRKELENAAYFREAFAENESVYIPRCYEQYSTKMVLVMEWVDGARVSDRDYLQRYRIDADRLVNTVIECFLKQILELGKFHADPHPGNMLVQADGTLILIDFGMVSTIRRSDVKSMVSLIQGLLFEDFGKVFKAMNELGFLLASADERELENGIRTLLDLYGNRAGKMMNKELLEEILTEITEFIHRQPIQMPSEFAFLGRAVSVLIGVLYRVTPEIDFVESARPVLLKWMDRHHSMRETAADYVKDWTKPLVELPASLQAFLLAPSRRIDWEKRKTRERYKHEMFMSGKRFAGTTFLLSLTALFAAKLVHAGTLSAGCGGVAAAAWVYYVVLSVRQSRWCRKVRDENN
ncbi:MAG TPA: AarF/UbiB family protein [Bacillales bacterium]|nr:AarF/UbiB family protein [Bacillales bacterium]